MTSASIQSRHAAPGASPSTSTRAQDAGLLVLRLALGLTLVAHGTQKLFGWFSGGGIDGTGQFFAASGYPFAKTFAVVAGLTETLGGLGIALGLLTPLAGAGLLGSLINATVVKGGGFFAPAGSEYELFLASAALAVTLTGPGGSPWTGYCRAFAPTGSPTASPRPARNPHGLPHPAAAQLTGTSPVTAEQAAR